MKGIAGILLALAACGPARSAEPSRPTVYLFLGSECPVSNFYAPEMERLARAWGARGAAFRAVYPESGLTAGEAESHALRYGLTFPAHVDAEQSLALAWGVTRVPQAIVVSEAGQVMYRGRIDDRYSPDGRRRDEPRTRDLEAALEAVLSGRRPDVSETPVFGCPLQARRTP